MSAIVSWLGFLAALTASVVLLALGLWMVALIAVVAGVTWVATGTSGRDRQANAVLGAEFAARVAAGLYTVPESAGGES